MHYYQINNLQNKTTYFLDENKNKISSDKIGSKFKKIPLGFPKGIIFYPYLNNVIYAKAYDNKNRVQYFYTQEYKDKQRLNKFSKNKNIVRKVKKILEECKTNLNSREQDKKWCISFIIMLMWECHIRVGNYKYKKLYDTNGAITISKNHLSINKSSINLKFIGKKGETNQCTLKKGNILYNHLKRLNLNTKKDMPLLCFKNSENKIKSLEYSDVYNYLKKKGVTPKDIRMINANLLYLKELNRNYHNFKNIEKERHSLILQNSILSKISKKMNHTKNVLKKDYLFPKFIGNKQDIINLIYNMKKSTNIFKFLEKSMKEKIV